MANTVNDSVEKTILSLGADQSKIRCLDVTVNGGAAEEVETGLGRVDQIIGWAMYDNTGAATSILIAESSTTAGYLTVTCTASAGDVSLYIAVLGV